VNLREYIYSLLVIC